MTSRRPFCYATPVPAFVARVFAPESGRRWIVTFVAVVVLLSGVGTHAMLHRLTLAEQVRDAGDIVHGVVADVTVGRDDSGILATWVTVDVARTLKGGAGARLTFKQSGGRGEAVDGSLLHVADLPAYRQGEELVLLLRRPSRRGFTSPVGLADSVFHVQRDTSGARVRDPAVAAATTDLDALLRAIETEMGRRP